MHALATSSAPCSAASEASVASVHCLSFSVGAQWFAVDILTVKEIVQTASITGVPLMPDCIRGVTNLRGAVVPVMDLQARLGRGVSVQGRKSCVVILDLTLPAGAGGDVAGERQLLGVMVDAVNAAVRIPADSIEPVPGFGLGLRAEFVSGLTQHQGRSLVLLQVESTFHMPQLWDAGESKDETSTTMGATHASH